MWVWQLTLFAVIAVCVQGLLGALTVKWMLPLWVSSAHATLAQLFFCTTVSLAVFTSRSWIEARALPEEEKASPLRHMCTIALVLILVQLVLGATLRHSAKWDQHLPAQLIVAHIVGAFAVTIALGGTSLSVLRRHKGETFLTRPATIALVLLVVQVFLGIASYVTRLGSPNDPQPLHPMIGVTVAHVACGALVFATTIVLTLRTYRVLPASEAAMEMAARPQES